nr:hypothetical protein [Tanacetum cinerariifolium]
SASILKNGLDEFSLSSGLHPSMTKSESFFNGLTHIIKAKNLMVMPYKEGELPIRCIGVPLVPKRVTTKDCKVLIEAVKTKIGDWKNKSLSLAGRL